MQTRPDSPRLDLAPAAGLPPRVGGPGRYSLDAVLAGGRAGRGGRGVLAAPAR